ncbi:methionyl-tRNA formyltransferase [Bosea sp. (in: a-proteobacteria)]|jgi:methionyl-tRNA formyltransferase|uniref:methionyl-tRNA formyltransferase n=1 Tax=Bosea sp. (in: a-proteobacteria) TaxID=1871050 RepID=UPI00273447DA|nr:formyltransferase family protein [Bosea sp. (in: a-proteobacteria)]MDP3407491.1 formyltransferase family protein [Bosea sp. (in: a-proteobacteria)]
MRRLRIGVIGRTEMLIEAARRAQAEGHEIALVATCKPSGHELATVADFEALAKASGAPFLRHRDLASEHGLDLVRQAQCDLAISMNWLTLIPAHVRALFALGVFNAHPGDLPRYKGNACPNWAILNGEERVGLSIHQMEDELDGGAIVAKRFLALQASTTIADVYGWLRTSIPEAFGEMVAAAARGELRLTPQSTAPEDSLRCYPRRPEDGKIDWQQPLAAIDRLIRASGHPFAGAFAWLEGTRKVTILAACPVLPREPFLAIPGQVAYAVDGDPVIAANGGYLRLTDLRVDGCVDATDARNAVLSSLRNRLT